MSTSNVPDAPRREDFPPPPPRPARSPRTAAFPSLGAEPAAEGRPLEPVGTRRQGRQGRPRRKRPSGWVLLAAVAAVGLIIWGIAALAGIGRPASVEASAYAKGDCFADFDAAAASGNRVPCTEPHSAQLVGVEKAADGGSYPGRDALEQRAGQLCEASDVKLPQDVSSLKQRSAYPNEDGWKSGDRRMDCYIVSTNGNTLTSSFLP
ncbi:septum formation family protein [Sinomonas atrocyanea]|uniref:septum formation family protein n=1 Tax=Sinomonas atrocyanea TaxID=37927 RepID=UPI002787EC11|nr:septum formation family protein [Sinomonas atrocyanea]MDQ0259088.1 hypothetical protein [Sinomonas atrocyanea]MDR6622620.1 hypothetical protein [Sinomonas atrocyanea]